MECFVAWKRGERGQLLDVTPVGKVARTPDNRLGLTLIRKILQVDMYGGGDFVPVQIGVHHDMRSGVDVLHTYARQRITGGSVWWNDLILPVEGMEVMEFFPSEGAMDDRKGERLLVVHAKKLERCKVTSVSLDVLLRGIQESRETQEFTSDFEREEELEDGGRSGKRRFGFEMVGLKGE